MTPKLTILIPTLISRRKLLDRLMDVLEPQIRAADPAVAVAIYTDEGEWSIGRKRQHLLEMASGEYVAFIDDDDLVPVDYVARILAALHGSPDSVGFKVLRYHNGRVYGVAEHSIAYGRYDQQPQNDFVWGAMMYERPPGHLTPIRRQLALKVGYNNLQTGEDKDFAERLYPHLWFEHFIGGEPMYHYLKEDENPDRVVALQTFGKPPRPHTVRRKSLMKGMRV